MTVTKLGNAIRSCGFKEVCFYENKRRLPLCYLNFSVGDFSVLIRLKTLNADFRNFGGVAEVVDQFGVCFGKMRVVLKALRKSKENKNK